MTYSEPKVTLTQEFSQSSTVVSDLKMPVVIVGPAYTMVDDEEHSHVSEPYIGNALTLTFGSANADIRATNTDELEYPVEVTFADAKCLVGTGAGGLDGSPVTTGSPMTLTEAGAFSNLPSSGTRTIKFTSSTGTSKHYVDVVSVSDRDVSNQRTITLNGPLAKDLDQNTTGFYRFFQHTYSTCLTPLPIVSIGSDRTTIVVQDIAGGAPTWPDADANNVSAGMYTIGRDSGTWAGGHDYIHPTYEKDIEFVIASKLSSDSVTTYDIGPNMEYADVMASTFYYHDVVEDDALGAGYVLSSTQITIPAATADSNGFLIQDATVHLKYRALKTNLGSALTRIDISSYATDIVTKLGAIVEHNTGAWAVSEACKGSKIDVYFLGLGSTYYTNVLTAFQTAESTLRDLDGYHVVFLSERPDVHALLHSHVDYMSDPDIGRWRVGYFNRELVTELSVDDGTTGTGASEGILFHTGSPQTHTFVDADGSFVGTVSEDDVLKVNSWSSIEPAITVLSATPIVDTTIGDNVTPTPFAYTPATKTLTMKWDLAQPLTNLRALITADKIVGRCVSFATTGAGNTFTPTANDTSMYIDSTHPLGSNDQQFKDLGYKIVYAADNGVDTVTLRFEAVGTAPTLNLNWAGALNTETVEVTILDSILDAPTEELLQSTGIVVGSVIDNHTLSLDSGLYNWGTSGVPDWHRAHYRGLDFDVYHPMTKDQQATYMSAYATSFAERRMRMCWPDTGTTSNGIDVKGYMICAAIAGAYAGMPPQESLTRHYISGPNTIEHSNDYFSGAQLNMLAEGGVTIMTQSVAGANIQCRHNQSTDTSTVYYREPSITHSVDRTSFMVKTTMDRLIGIYNITQELFDVASMAMESIKKRVEKTLPRVGGILKQMNVISIKQDTTEIDHVEVIFDAIPNVPCNGFNVTMRVK